MAVGGAAGGEKRAGVEGGFDADHGILDEKGTFKPVVAPWSVVLRYHAAVVSHASARYDMGSNLN
jgi:hypothetical protein